MSPGRIEILDGRPVDQIGIVVRDLERSLERYSRLWGGGPWRCYTYGPATVPTLTYRGEPGRFAVRLALGAGTPQLELLQPLEGPSIYHEWLEAHDEGLHHLGVFVDSIEEAVASMARAGYGVLQSGAGYGLDGDGGFAYFDTECDLGVVVEAIEVPQRRREPELVWP